MTCSEFAGIARDVARGLDGAGAAEARAHVDGCAACRERLEDEQRLSAGLAALAASMEPLAAPPGVECRLRQAFRERHAVPRRRPVQAWRWLAWAVPAVAALAAAAVLIPWFARPAEPLRGADALAKLAAKAPEARPAVLPAARPEQPVARRRVRRERPAAMLAGSVRPEAEQPAEVMKFVPVRFARPLFPDERAEVIRVSLPGSALRRFGMYVPADFAIERVSADVLMGEDGVARAIRFVR